MQQSHNTGTTVKIDGYESSALATACENLRDYYRDEYGDTSSVAAEQVAALDTLARAIRAAQHGMDGDSCPITVVIEREPRDEYNRRGKGVPDVRKLPGFDPSMTADERVALVNAHR